MSAPVQPAVCHRATVQVALAVLKRLRPGDGTCLRLPANPYSRREAYRQIAGNAYRLWGKGGYRVGSFGQDMTVIRVRIVPMEDCDG